MFTAHHERLAVREVTKTVLLAEPYMSIRCIYSELLSDIPHVQVVGEAATGRHTLELARELEPDILLLDRGIFGDDCYRRVSELTAKTEKRPEVLLLSDTADLAAARQLMDAGARGYLTKNSVPDYLVPAVQAVLNGDTYVRLTPKLT